MIATDLALGTASLIALLAPGTLLALRWRLPQPLLAGFVVSAVALFALVLALQVAGSPLAAEPLRLAWGGFTLGAGVFWWLGRMQTRSPFERPRFPWAGNRLLLLPLVPMLIVVAYRACAQPLHGVDTIFRWNYLAEQMLARGTLDFYPPVTAADYEIYAWPDGIAPLVSTLYFWLYAIAGEARPALTAPLVVFQFVLVVLAVFALARKFFSERAGLLATALVAATPLIGWASGMGQETGLTAIALVALLLYLPRTRGEETTASLVVAALAASLGALAREYGLVLPLVGLGLCVARKLSPRACMMFAMVAAVGIAPWYARNGMLTGNPLFGLATGGLFPGNPVHAWINASFQLEHGWAHLPPEALRLILTNCLAALIGGGAGAVLWHRKTPSLVVAAALFVALWAVALGYTAAGFMYALRVLNPALAIGAVLGGAALARWLPERRLGVAAVALTLVAIDAALRTLTLPANVYRIPPGEWLAAGHALQDYHERPIYRELARVAGSERILALGPNALLARQGARAVPLWSPEVRFVFDDALPPAEIARRLRAAGIGHVLLTTGRVNERFLAHSAFFRDPAGALQPVWSDADMVLLRVNAPP